ncbi:hypothetical protein FCL47_14565 [Desulfopila sp. IMCC35006]|nr:hypothetical protein FCL47_14565 [Desulfopila sp. IMCC35006]
MAVMQEVYNDIADGDKVIVLRAQHADRVEFWREERDKLACQESPEIRLDLLQEELDELSEDLQMLLQVLDDLNKTTIKQ